MPSKLCMVCKRVIEYSRTDWMYFGKLDSAPCSVGCVLKWIKTFHSPGNYLEYAIRLGNEMGIPDESYSVILQRCFRSDFEKRVAERLALWRIRFEYEKYAFPVKGTTLWCPDFHLPDCNSFIEVKGKWGAGAYSKVLDFQERYPDIKLLVIPWTLNKGFAPL